MGDAPQGDPVADQVVGDAPLEGEPKKKFEPEKWQVWESSSSSTWQWTATGWVEHSQSSSTSSSSGWFYPMWRDVKCDVCGAWTKDTLEGPCWNNGCSLPDPRVAAAGAVPPPHKGGHIRPYWSDRGADGHPHAHLSCSGGGGQCAETPSRVGGQTRRPCYVGAGPASILRDALCFRSSCTGSGADELHHGGTGRHARHARLHRQVQTWRRAGQCRGTQPREQERTHDAVQRSSGSWSPTGMASCLQVLQGGPSRAAPAVPIFHPP